MSPRYNLGLRNQSEQVQKPLIVRAVVHTALPDDITGIIIVNSLLLSCTILEVLRERENFRVTVVVGALLNHGRPPLSVNQVVRLPLPPADCTQRTKACYIPAAGSLGSTPPSSAPLSTLPTGLAGTPRSCCGRLPTWFAWQQEPGLLFSLPPKLTLAAIPSEPSPISPFAPAPFSAAKLRI